MGCSTAIVNVMPGEDGVNVVSAKDIEKADAEKAVVEAAQEYCKKKGKEAVFIESLHTQYTGSMDEKTRNLVRTGSRTMSALGAMQTNVGEKRSNALSGVGTAGEEMTSDRDYEAKVRFKCK
jgi:hypothetical protein